MNEQQEAEEPGVVGPWTDVWVRPRQTIEWIIDNYSSTLTTIVLIYLGGVHFGISAGEINHTGDKKEVGEILTGAFLISGLGGLVTYSIWIWAIDFCASWFGGKGNFRKTQIAFAWSMLPRIAGIVLALMGYILFEEELFTNETPNINTSDSLYVLFWIYRTGEMVLGMWHVVLVVVMVSHVQKISTIKSFLSIITAFVLLMLPIFLIGLLLY